MSEKPFAPGEGQAVRLGGKKWVVGKRNPTGGFVIRPAAGDGPPRIAAAKEMAAWTDDAVDDAPQFSPQEIEAALGRPVRLPPEWVTQVIDDLLAEWRAAWAAQPVMLRGIELGANLAAAIAARWVLEADPARLAELAGEEYEREDPRPLAIGILTGVVLPVGLQQVQREPEPSVRPAS
ncbi:hypothetical protein [Nannocystis bainbridge]|uniref:Uncharacterized protein n=1 Tax=Nannocystis bainbridge TaxID=2995303 RepID=A0ABT5E249_9BACT|nr:hypothetical protein [Nannocystis bainbridge]MDC0719947.1 hypothetical protein [Nannocystis bainbridge]